MRHFNLELAENNVNDEVLYKLPKNAEMLINGELYVVSFEEGIVLNFCFLELKNVGNPDEIDCMVAEFQT